MLLALGGVDYDGDAERDATPPADVEPSGAIAAVARGAAAPLRFPPLPHAAAEARAIAQLFERAFGGLGASAVLLEERSASRRALEDLAPEVSFLHVATHGWIAAEAPAEVSGLSPMVLCGLALAGANRPADILGRVAGMVTAEEMATWNLSRCELAVLSACDTGSGRIRRAGQGVASLQKALHSAGARMVVTSLWRVPDEATAELMVDFYQRLWIEREPEHRALWKAKMSMRDRGRPARDWAAWILSGPE
jgi:CHAT domain-containing protein